MCLGKLFLIIIFQVDKELVLNIIFADVKGKILAERLLICDIGISLGALPVAKTMEHITLSIIHAKVNVTQYVSESDNMTNNTYHYGHR